MQRNYGLIGWVLIGCLPGILFGQAASPAAANAASLQQTGKKPADMARAGFALIPSGSFDMGESELAEPVHAVDISAFYMERVPVTKAQWNEVRAWATNNGYAFDNSGWGKATNHPVRTVDWYDCIKWCNARTEREFGAQACCYYTNTPFTPKNVYRTGELNINNSFVNWNTNGYRLPTESEWEKAARGGVEAEGLLTADASSIASIQAPGMSPSSSDVGPSWKCDPTYGNVSLPVGSISTNGYGLYDIAGPVWEWCWDWYVGYSSSPSRDPRGPAAPTDEALRVIRGGSWYKYVAGKCRAAGRGFYSPGDEFYFLGFRCVRSQ